MKPIYMICIISLGTSLFGASCSPKNKHQAELVPRDQIPVKVASVQSLQTSTDILATGLVTTQNEAKYSFKVGGVISNIYLQEGQFFKKGQLLATLNSTEIGSSLEQAKLNTEKAHRDYQRASNLYKDSVATLEQLQNARTGLDISQKQQDAVAFNARYANIFATSDGFVTQKLANKGEVISPGSPILDINEISGNNDYTLKVGVTSQQWTKVHISQKAFVTLDGFPGDTIKAYVYRKSQSTGQSDGSFQIELKLLSSNIKPAIGMFGRATVLSEKKVNAMVIPYDALIEADGSKAFVFVLLANDRVKKVPIEIEAFDDNKVYVKKGIGKTSTIVVSNSAFLNEQSYIKIIN